MYTNLKKRVFDANFRLYEEKLIALTWGNVSEIDRDLGVIAIKPSGVAYLDMSYEDIVVVDLDGLVVEGSYKPSSDLATHLVLYNEFESIGGITHTHSRHATAFAQAQKSIDNYGTTHADTFYGSVVCTRNMTHKEIEIDYEKNTGLVIVEKIKEYDRDVMDIPAMLVASHGPFTWGKSANNSVDNSIVLEEVAYMNLQTLSLNSQQKSIDKFLQDKHYFRKHGAGAYYGQE